MIAKEGDLVSVIYKGSFDNGKIFDSTENNGPFEFVIGKSGLLNGFEKAIIGMKQNDVKEIRIKPEEAYGKRNEKLKQEIPMTALGGIKVKEGSILKLKDKDGKIIDAFVSKINKKKVFIDFNHPLAGKHLNFKIKIVNIKEPGAQE